MEPNKTTKGVESTMPVKQPIKNETKIESVQPKQSSSEETTGSTAEEEEASRDLMDTINTTKKDHFLDDVQEKLRSNNKQNGAVNRIGSMNAKPTTESQDADNQARDILKDNRPEQEAGENGIEKSLNETKCEETEADKTEEGKGGGKAIRRKLNLNLLRRNRGKSLADQKAAELVVSFPDDSKNSMSQPSPIEQKKKKKKTTVLGRIVRVLALVGAVVVVGPLLVLADCPSKYP